MKPSKETVKLFQNHRFATENGAVIEEVDDHYAKCSLKIENRHRNAMGAVMGGVYFTLADFAGGCKYLCWLPRYNNFLSRQKPAESEELHVRT